MRLSLLPVFAILGLAACGDPAERYAVPVVPPAEEVRIAYASVEVREVALPTYATLEEIFVETESGALVSSPDLLWADDPSRATTQELVRALASVTGAQVAAEPWPFDSFPQVRIEVRVDDFVASVLGAEFRASGQAFVAPVDGAGRERTVPFRIAVPLDPEAGPAGIAAARAAAMAELATRLAQEGLR